MGHFDEVCLLCGATPIPPSGFTNASEITAEELVASLLEYFPSILEECQVEGIESKDDLENYLSELMDEFEDFFEFAEAFRNCIAIGYFDDDGAVVAEEVPDDTVVERRIPDGKFVTTRMVDDPNCGEFEQEVIQKKGEDGVVIEEREERMTRTGAYWQKGIGNFFLSEPCYRLLQTWIALEDLPPMCDGRKLSFEGELWEVINSRETGRNNGGWLDWLEPGGAEKKLEQTQYELATGGPLTFKIAEALREGHDREDMKTCMLDDYGLWMFANPHEWPSLDDTNDMVALTDIGFDISPRLSPSSSTLGALSRFSPAVLVQIFGWLPSVGSYLNLKTVSQRMHDLVVNSNFTAKVLREMLQPDPNRALYWVHPIDKKHGDDNKFKTALKTWVASDDDAVPEHLILSPEFPIIQFVYALYAEDSPRNRRRLWNNVQRLKEVWVDYRLNGWKVNRFGVPYPSTEEPSRQNE